MRDSEQKGNPQIPKAGKLKYFQMPRSSLSPPPFCWKKMKLIHGPCLFGYIFMYRYVCVYVCIYIQAKWGRELNNDEYQ